MITSLFRIRFFVAALALLLVVCTNGSAVFAQNSNAGGNPDNEEMHGADAAKWYAHLTNPTNDPNIIERKLKGLEEFRRMSNLPALVGSPGTELEFAL